MTANPQLPIKVVLCGLGWWGVNWLKNIQQNKDYLLVGVVEENQGVLKNVAPSHGLADDQCFGNVEKAILEKKPDAVIVVVSPNRHGEIITVAMRHETHILSEKPLAKDLAEAKYFLRLHEKNKKVKFIVNQNYRGRACIAQLKEMIDARSIGDVGFFIFSHQQTVRIPGYRLEMPSPVVDDMSIHHFDLIRYLTKQNYEEIYASEGTVPWSWFKGKPLFSANIRMSGAISGMYFASWASEGKIGSWNGNIQIFGSEGCLELTEDEKILLFRKHDVDENMLGRHIPGEEIPVKRLEHTELQFTLENFKNALIHGHACETDITDNVKSFAGVIASKESIRSRKPVAIRSMGL